MSKKESSRAPSPVAKSEQSQPRSDDSKVDDFIKCEICRQIIIRPRTLDCIHSFCRDCLTTYITETTGKGTTSGNVIICPLCLQTTYPQKSTNDIKEWSNELPVNEFLRSFIEAMSLTDPKRKCDTCHRQHRSETAQQWCSSCHDALCDSCVSFHNALKTTKKHHLVYLSKLRNQPIHNIIVAPHCPFHDGETVSKYCPVHQDAICDKCQVGVHKGCKGIMTLKEAAASRKQDFNKTMATLGDETKLAKTIYEDRSKSDKMLDDQQARLLQHIQNVRKKINSNLANCESQLIGELYTVHSKEKHTIQADMKDAQRTRKAASKLQSLTETTSKYGTDCHLMMNLPIAERQSEHYKEKLVTINNNLRHTDLEFVVDASLEKLMNGIQRIGELKVRSMPAVLATPQTLRGSGKADSDPEDEYDIRRSRRTLKFEDDVQSLKSVKSLRSIRSMRSTIINIYPSLDETFSARSESDTEICWITGITVMPNGQIILVDRNNCKLKAFNKSYKLLHEMKLKYQPFGITQVPPDQIAITIPREDKLDIYKVGTIFTLSRSVKVPDRGYGITYADGKFAVTCACASTPFIVIMSTSGEIKKHLRPEDNYHPMFLRPWYVKMDTSGSTLFISDCHTSQVTSISGAVVRQFVYKDESLNSPRGLYLTRDRRLLVCGFGTDNVQLLNSSGQHIGDVLTRKDCIMGPQDVALNFDETKMVVTFDPSSGMGDAVQVYNVNL